MFALIVETLAVVSNWCGLGAASREPQPACPGGGKSYLPNGQLKWMLKGTVPNTNAFSVVAIFNSVQYLLTYFPRLGYLQCSHSQGWCIWTRCKNSSHFQSGSSKVGCWPWIKGWASGPAHVWLVRVTFSALLRVLAQSLDWRSLVLLHVCRGSSGCLSNIILRERDLWREGVFSLL